ncbi:hypothetical protein VTL71DRAFT_1877 [Oculimacula yallundae]|uniref:Amidoligase enzyme n=1 Tax=Oculimacula yallundae TaxID=86028 RepID=A0ABR4CCP7_9HELO
MATNPINNSALSQKHKERLTFGLELEFAVAFIRPGSTDPNPKDTRPVDGLVTGPHDCWIANLREHIAATFRAVNLKASAQSPFTEESSDQALGAWTIKHDETIKAPSNDAGYLFLPIEISSPAYWNTDKAFAEVKLACQELTKNYRILTNRSCGVHVHIGKGMRGFRFEDIQNLLATLWTFEPVLETIHPRYRVQDQKMCPSFRRYSALAVNHTPRPQEGQQKGVLDVRGALEEILGVQTGKFDHLVDLSMPQTRDSYMGGSRLAYHLGDVGGQLPVSSNYRRTIEFRQHKGSVKYSEIEMWIKFCLGIVMFADSVDRPQLAPFLRAHSGRRKEDLKLEEVLRCLDMRELADRYPKKIAQDREEGEGKDEPLYSIEVGMTYLTTPL